MNKEENMEREMDDSFLDKKFKANPFIVPDNYFNNLEEQILAISKIPFRDNKEDFKAPDGYFENLDTKIFSQVSLEKISKENDFKVPTLYFEKLSTNILEKVKKPAKVVRFSFMKYAAAASLLISITFGAYLYNLNNQTITKKLANIPDQEIADYLKLYTDANDVSLIIESTDDISLIEENLNRQISN